MVSIAYDDSEAPTPEYWDEQVAKATSTDLLAMANSKHPVPAQFALALIRYLEPLDREPKDTELIIILRAMTARQREKLYEMIS
jgi:hypothetical protein